MGVILKARDLHKHFHMGSEKIEVLKGINLDVESGHMLGIVGVSGSGKSTLLHVLGGLDRPDFGSNILNGHNVFKMKSEKLADFRNKNIGFVFQSHHLLPEFSALENVMIPGLILKKNKNKVEEKASKILCSVGLSKRMNHNPGKLSGGEQQRTAIARALMNDPDIIFADEPTGNLDSKTGESIHNLLRELNQSRGQTFIIVTHDENLVRNMDLFIRLADGNIIYSS